MPLLIRSLEPKDLKTVADISQSTTDHTWTDLVFADCLKESYLNWVLCLKESDEIIGFLVALLQGEECQLMNIGIAKTYRQRGYAAQLMRYLRKVLSYHLVKRIFLEVRCSNKAAIALYKKIGFKEIGLRKNYYSRGNHKEDALMFCLELQ